MKEKYESYIRTINLKCQAQHGMKNLNYLMGHILLSDIQNYFEYIMTRY